MNLQARVPEEQQGIQRILLQRTDKQEDRSNDGGDLRPREEHRHQEVEHDQREREEEDGGEQHRRIGSLEHVLREEDDDEDANDEEHDEVGEEPVEAEHPAFEAHHLHENDTARNWKERQKSAKVEQWFLVTFRRAVPSNGMPVMRYDGSSQNTPLVRSETSRIHILIADERDDYGPGLASRPTGLIRRYPHQHQLT